ncbi:MAG TPA: tyrosine-type recombinase/integrase [Steroidobacteraceae bacterium]|nr:tyrosine-type recombinase/integrase [Steroidobacteraceae bacterium]
MRHTFASWAAMAGAPDRVLQRLGGWSSPAMLTRYAHLSAGDTRSWASAACANAVAGVSAVMPEVMAKAQEIQGVEWCRLTESNCGPHHYE